VRLFDLDNRTSVVQGFGYVLAPANGRANTAGARLPVHIPCIQEWCIEMSDEAGALWVCSGGKEGAWYELLEPGQGYEAAFESERKKFVATVAVYQTLQACKVKGTAPQLMRGLLRRLAAQARDSGKGPVTEEFVLQELKFIREQLRTVDGTTIEQWGQTAKEFFGWLVRPYMPHVRKRTCTYIETPVMGVGVGVGKRVWRRACRRASLVRRGTHGLCCSYCCLIACSYCCLRCCLAGATSEAGTKGASQGAAKEAAKETATDAAGVQGQ
jgi:hypothetical protein